MAILTATGRPARSTANGRKYDRWGTGRLPVDRPKGGNTVSFYRSTDTVDRKDTESKLSISVDWSVASVDRQTCTTCACPDTAAGRLPVDRSAWNRISGQIFEIENFVKINLLTLLENPQKYVLSFYLITKLVIKISRHISNISIHFCVLLILSKNKTVFLSNLIFPKHE